MKPIVDLAGNVALPDNPIVVTPGPLVGLGDHAIYSTLARRFNQLGYAVYYDADTAARNDDIFNLFWRDNPHFVGPSKAKPNAGYVRQGLFYEIANREPIGAIEAMERAHGLPPPYGIAPWSAYEPKPYHLDFSQTVLMDFSAVSSTLTEQAIGEFLRTMKGRFRNAPFVQVIVPKWASLHGPQVQCESIAVRSVYEYLDALSSCRAWIGSEAGGQSLAAMARGERDAYDRGATPEVVVLATPRTFNSRGYTYRGVDYRVTGLGDEPSDHWFPAEVGRHVYELQCALSFEAMRVRA